MTRCFVNPAPGVPGIVVLPSGGFRRAKAEITSWGDYRPTPLHELPMLADSAAVDRVAIKDEQGRFGLGSFKALGGGYAVGAVVASERARTGAAAGSLTVTCATDGNHGRSVAWGAQRAGARCVVFVHADVSAARVAAIERYGAAVRRAGATYDESVGAANDAAAREGWSVVSDTSWPGYTEVPRLVMQGYRVMVDEALDQWGDATTPTHVFIQAGVGGVAAAVAAHLRSRLPRMPRVVVVEPERAACLLASAERGAPTSLPGPLDTVMACLACGMPSLLAWQELERSADAYLAIDDPAAIDAMRRLAALGIVSGESGAAGLAGLGLAASDAALRATLGIDRSSRVLLFSTEGATDPTRYAELVGSSG